MSLKSLLVTALAAVGFGSRQSIRSAPCVYSSPVLSPQVFESAVHSMRDRGHPPHIWGTSRACAQMRRKNKLRSIGISGQRI